MMYTYYYFGKPRSASNNDRLAKCLAALFGYTLKITPTTQYVFMYKEYDNHFQKQCMLKRPYTVAEKNSTLAVSKWGHFERSKPIVKIIQVS